MGPGTRSPRAAVAGLLALLKKSDSTRQPEPDWPGPGTAAVARPGRAAVTGIQVRRSSSSGEGPKRASHGELAAAVTLTATAR